MNGEGRLAARDCLNKEGEEEEEEENAWIKRRGRERERKPCQQGHSAVGEFWREKVMRGIKSNTAPVGSGGGQGKR